MLLNRAGPVAMLDRDMRYLPAASCDQLQLFSSRHGL